MFKNYLKIALRTLLRGKVYTALNVLGLAVGLACFGLITAWCMNELSYDRVHTKHDRIFRIAAKVTTDSETFDQAVTAPPMAEALKQDFPMDFMRSKDLGFNQEELLVLDVNGLAQVRNGIQPFRNELLSQAKVKGFALSRGLIVNGLGNSYIETISRGKNVRQGFYGVRGVVTRHRLFGLAAFAAEQRTKEIGIRKVLGASWAGLAGLLSKDFVKLVLFANAIAWPVAYFAMNKWLQNFAYRVELGWWLFVLAGGSAVIIALVTVSTQALKAALANPIEALRYE